MKLVTLLGALVLAGLVYGVAAPASAGANNHVDKKRGFATKIGEDMKQVPPKPTGDPKYLAAEFYDDQAKYKSSGSTNPEFKITWWSTPKVATTPGAGDAAAPPAADAGEEFSRYSSIDQLVDEFLSGNTQLFGPFEPPMNERWATAKAGKTTKQKIDYQYLELNPVKPKKKDGPQPKWYLFVARLHLERPTESVDVAFHGWCAIEFAKNLGPEYLSIVKNFETIDSTGLVKDDGPPKDPEQFRAYIKKTKVIAGWKYLDSPKKQYAIVYEENVKDDLARQIGQEIETIRAQIYETLFPPDKPVTAVSVIRICKDVEQYRAYGGPVGSAGFWSWNQMELVFYKDSGNPIDALRVLYHEAFHQYIFYSAGAVSPHSWFNEGHGDYFAGHNYKDGRFVPGEFAWRKDLAKSLKREKRNVPLEQWLTWDQGAYYGGNKNNLAGGDNYALGWDFIWFLRTTKKTEYQGFLPRYFNALKGYVTAARDVRNKERAKRIAEGQDPGPDVPEAIENMAMEDAWCQDALKEAVKGIDMAQLEKDWLAN